MAKNYMWVKTGIPPKCKLSSWDKERLKAVADQFVEEFYRPILEQQPPETEWNHVVDNCAPTPGSNSKRHRGRTGGAMKAGNS